MPISSLTQIKNFFSSNENPESEKELYQELLLTTLARAAKADLYTSDVEVELVQKTLKNLIDEDISLADIRTAASSELFETVPLKKYLERAAPKMKPEHNVAIVKALIEVCGVDGRISDREVEYFDMVAHALKISPSELVGLTAS